MTSIFKSVLLASLLVLCAPSSRAHTTLRGTVPASGSVLTESPPSIELTFLEPARLTSLMIVTAAGERPLAFTPTASALTFVSAEPRLEPGRNEIRWTALSRDGHVIEGHLIIVLRVATPSGA
jgi:methionine-rich copper-binding protein CopC